MRVLICNDQPDCAGVGYRWAQAGRLAGHDVHSVANGTNVFNYPQDWLWDQNRAEIEAFKPDLYMLTNGITDVCTLLGHEPRNAIVLHHGSDIRYGTKPNYDKSARAYSYDRGWPVYVSTPDLEWLVPDTEWLPAAMPPLGRYRKPEGTVITHAPSHRNNKGTREILSGLAIARQRAVFDIDVIEGVPNEDCLIRKGRSAVFIDQIKWGYGVNTLEALAMGVPVVSGFINNEIHAYVQGRIGELPFLVANNAQEVSAAVLRLLQDSEEASRVTKIGAEYLAQWHAPEVVSKNLDRIWRQAC